MPSPLSPARVAEIRCLRADGLTQVEVARICGVNRRTVWWYAPGRPSKVPVGPVREAFLRSGKTYTEVARQMGWECRRGADTSRLKRTLGLLPDNPPSPTRRTYVDVETVERLADAIGVGAWEVLP